MLSRKILLAILLASPSCWLFAADSPEIVEDFRSTMAQVILGDVRDDFGPKLIESGMAELDVDRILNELTDAAIDCIMDDLSEYAAKHSTDLESLVTPDENGEVLAANAMLKSESMHICVLTAFENAGLVLD